MSKHRCTVGQYAHSTSEYCDLGEDLETDGMASLFPFIQYDFCPGCGKSLKQFWKDSGYKYKAPKFRIPNISPKKERNNVP